MQGGLARGWRLGAAALAMALAVSAAPSQAPAQPLAEFLRLCSSPDTPPRDALRFCRMALDSGALTPEQAAQVHYNIGLSNRELGRFGAAVSAHGEALALDPGLTAALVSRGQAHEAMGQAAEARADYDRAIETAGRDAGAYLARGTLSLREGRFGAAIDDLTRAARLERDWAAPRFERGRAYYGQGDYGLAERDFTAVIGLDPRDATAWLNRAETRAAMGKEAAINDFDRAVMLAPEWGAARYARGRYLERIGEEERANADFLRAYQLGHSAPGLIERVQRLSGG